MSYQTPRQVALMRTTQRSPNPRVRARTHGVQTPSLGLCPSLRTRADCLLCRAAPAGPPLVEDWQTNIEYLARIIASEDAGGLPLVEDELPDTSSSSEDEEYEAESEEEDAPGTSKGKNRRRQAKAPARRGKRAQVGAHRPSSAARPATMCYEHTYQSSCGRGVVKGRL